VSVIIPAYNPGSFLNEAIESVLSQTHQNWELILVDDASTDGSGEFSQACAARSPDRIRYVTHPGRANRGTSASRNLGIACSTGDLIAFLDADDVWFPDKLEKQVRILRNRPEVGLVYGQARVWHSWSPEPDSRPDYEIEPDLPRDCLVPPPGVVQCFLRNELYAPFPSAALIRKADIDRVGGFEGEYRGPHEDQVFFAKICLESAAYVSAEPVFLYRVHTHSAVHAPMAQERLAIERKRFLDWLQEYLAGRIPMESPLWRELRLQRRRYTHPRLDRIVTSLKVSQTLLVRFGSTLARRVLPADRFHQLRAFWRELKS
jgi:glycosyltransferase involved in cell wall biosynthesis